MPDWCPGVSFWSLCWYLSLYNLVLPLSYTSLFLFPVLTHQQPAGVYFQCSGYLHQHSQAVAHFSCFYLWKIGTGNSRSLGNFHLFQRLTFSVIGYFQTYLPKFFAKHNSHQLYFHFSCNIHYINFIITGIFILRFQ